LKDAAVTGSFDGGEKRKPCRIRNRYVSRSVETRGYFNAASGTTVDAAAADASGKLTSFRQVA
jgi:hypothetical protein